MQLLSGRERMLRRRQRRARRARGYCGYGRSRRRGQSWVCRRGLGGLAGASLHRISLSLSRTCWHQCWSPPPSHRGTSSVHGVVSLRLRRAREERDAASKNRNACGAAALDASWDVYIYIYIYIYIIIYIYIYTYDYNYKGLSRVDFWRTAACCCATSYRLVVMF